MFPLCSMPLHCHPATPHAVKLKQARCCQSFWLTAGASSWLPASSPGEASSWAEEDEVSSWAGAAFSWAGAGTASSWAGAGCAPPCRVRHWRRTAVYTSNATGHPPQARPAPSSRTAGQGHSRVLTQGGQLGPIWVASALRWTDCENRKPATQRCCLVGTMCPKA